MKRGRGRREKIEKSSNIKYLFYSSLGVLIIMIVTFIVTYIIYTNKIKNSNYSELTAEKMAELVPNDTNMQLEEASSDIGKSIEEVIKSTEMINDDSTNDINSNTNNNETGNIINNNNDNSQTKKNEEKSTQTSVKP